MINDHAGEVTEELFESLFNRYQIGQETSIRGSDFIFDCPHLLYYKCHKINPNRGRSYIDSADWIKNKKGKINLTYKRDNKYLQYAVTVALNHEEIGRHPERITKIKLFTKKYNWGTNKLPI